MNTNIYRFKVGTFECIAASDGVFGYPDYGLFVNAPKERLAETLRQYNIHPGEIMLSYTCLLINTGKQQVLVDTGEGPRALPGVGKLFQNLQTVGIKPADIDTVILTHGHPDHIGGNTDAECKPAFPNARYIMWKDEWEFWTSEQAELQLKLEDDLKNILLTFARDSLPPIQSQLDLIDRETEILPGIRAIASPGHTPGHMVLAISSGGEQLLVISDTALSPIHLEQPDWYSDFDIKPEQAIAARHRLMDRAAAEKTLVFAFHFPFPGLGHIFPKGEGRRWQPIETRG